MTTQAPQGGPPAAPAAPAPEGGAPPAPPPAGDGAEVKLTSRQLQERLGESSASGRKALLSEYGFKSQDELKTAIDRLKSLENEKLTAEQRAQKQIEELGAKAKDGEAHAATSAAAIDLLFATLTPEQRAVIETAAPATPAAKLQMIQLARAFAGAAPPAPAGAPPPPPAPTTTTPPTGAPKPNGGQKTAYERYAEYPEHSLRAAAFYKANAAEIEASRPPPR